ncbi:stringent starvation protein B [Marinospirillum celere]|uniref:Stringent starvation protein B n=1 Tax=Marinospirillum celere TaxID=1122252 RepID=A0A1I1FXP0_9GAMM|nr:ClpXP protease specificity-enhancing factor [Marinospirillum celere]SFC04339.1 stringent starvation protein B [Marinospirillum celere]
MTSSSRPYLLRGLYEWLLDNHLTPHVIIAADLPGVEVPREQVQEGQLVLNISDTATRGLEISNEALTFSARFGGVPRQLYIPMEAVVAIYARENGAGMVFGQEPGVEEALEEEEASSESPSAASEEAPASASRQASHLKVVK